jgi:hypothetical protein
LYKRILISLAIAATVSGVSVAPSKAGSIFVSGEDPDFHDQQGPNTVGAKNIIDHSPLLEMGTRLPSSLSTPIRPRITRLAITSIPNPV